MHAPPPRSQASQQLDPIDPASAPSPLRPSFRVSFHPMHLINFIRMASAPASVQELQVCLSGPDLSSRTAHDPSSLLVSYRKAPDLPLLT